VGTLATTWNTISERLKNGDSPEWRRDALMQFGTTTLAQFGEKSRSPVLWGFAAGVNSLWNASHYYGWDFTPAFKWVFSTPTPPATSYHYRAPLAPTMSQYDWLKMQGMNPAMSTWNQPVPQEGH
jgi:hypothetical protein